MAEPIQGVVRVRVGRMVVVVPEARRMFAPVSGEGLLIELL